MFSDFSISPAFFDFICNLVPEGSTMLELGSGTMTEEFCKRYTVYSVEHDPNWVGKYSSNYIYAPLKEHKIIRGYTGGFWYDPDILRKELPKKYDFLLIDGPPTPNRSGIVKYLNLFYTDCPIAIDDIHRGIERKMAHSIAARIKRPYTIYNSWQKPFGIFHAHTVTT